MSAHDPRPSWFHRRARRAHARVSYIGEIRDRIAVDLEHRVVEPLSPEAMRLADEAVRWLALNERRSA
jgi:hypothetical protein